MDGSNYQFDLIRSSLHKAAVNIPAVRHVNILEFCETVISLLKMEGAQDALQQSLDDKRKNSITIASFLKLAKIIY